MSEDKYRASDSAGAAPNSGGRYASNLRDEIRSATPQRGSTTDGVDSSSATGGGSGGAATPQPVSGSGAAAAAKVGGPSRSPRFADKVQVMKSDASANSGDGALLTDRAEGGVAAYRAMLRRLDDERTDGGGGTVPSAMRAGTNVLDNSGSLLPPGTPQGSPRAPDDAIPQTPRSSAAGSSSHGNKDLQLAKLLEMVPNKDREELLIVDIDDAAGLARGSSSKEGSGFGAAFGTKQRDKEALVNELEECAAANEKTKRFYEEILDNPFVATVVIDAHSQLIVWCNTFATFMFNLVESELVGEDVCMLMGIVPDRDNKTFHRKKIANFLHTWKRRKAQPESKIVSGRVQELIATRYEGINKINFAVQMVVRPVQMTIVDQHAPPFAFVGYFRDYSIEKMLRGSLATHRFISDQASEAIVVIDTTGMIKEMNKACCELFGYDGEFLIRNEANVSMLTPPATAAIHDRYMKAFREKLATPGFDIRTSPIVGKARDLKGRRADGKEFPLQLRVEFHSDGTKSGGDRLIGYFRDSRALIKASDFQLEVSKRLFPESVAQVVAQKSEASLVETHRNIPVILIDMVGFTGKTRNMDHEAVFEMVNTMYKNIAELAVGYQVEVVKSTGDGVIAVCGIDEFDEAKSRMDRAVCFAITVLKWTHENDTPVRIGIGYGELGSAVFEVAKGRSTWDVWAAAVNEASFMEHHAGSQTVQITASAFKAIRDAGIVQLFSARQYGEGIKGMTEGNGGSVVTYQSNFGSDFDVASDIAERVLNAALSRVYLKRENARALKDQQERRALTQA